jgi:hypothetical protein
LVVCVCIVTMLFKMIGNMKNVEIMLHSYCDHKPGLFLIKNVIKYSRVFMNLRGYRGLMCHTCHSRSLHTGYGSVLKEAHNALNKCHGSPSRTLYRYYNTMSIEDIPALSESQIRRTLKGYGLNFVDGFTCLVTECPICEQQIRKQIGRMYINKVTGNCSYWSKYHSLIHHLKHVLHYA